MFDKNLEITGKHGDYVRKLVGDIDDKKNSIFKHGYQVYKNAAIIGYLFNKRAKKDSTPGCKSFTIFVDQLSGIRDDLEFNYRLIMLLDKKHDGVLENRLKKAFNDYGSDNAGADELLFDEYSLGGIEVLFEKVMKDANRPEEYLLNLFNFIQDFNDQFNIQTEEIDLIKLCRSVNFK